MHADVRCAGAFFWWLAGHWHIIRGFEVVSLAPAAKPKQYFLSIEVVFSSSLCVRISDGLQVGVFFRVKFKSTPDLESVLFGINCSDQYARLLAQYQIPSKSRR